MQGSRWTRDHAHSSNTRGVNKNKANICLEGARDCIHKHSSDRDFTYPLEGDRALTYMQSNIPQPVPVIPVTDHVMGMPIPHIMPTLSKHPCIELLEQLLGTS